MFFSNFDSYPTIALVLGVSNRIVFQRGLRKLKEPFSDDLKEVNFMYLTEFYSLEKGTIGFQNS